MCRKNQQINRVPHGYLFKTKQNGFIYICSACSDEFSNGNELEEHTNVHYLKNEPGFDDHNITLTTRHHLQPVSVAVEKLSTERHSPTLLDNSTDTAFEIIPCLPTESIKSEYNFTEADPISSDAWNPDENDLNKSDCFTKAVSKPKKLKQKEKKTPKEKSFECDVCKRMFTSYGFLKRHLLGGHKNRKDWFHINAKRKKKDPVPCKICGKKLVAINLHMRTFHSTDRPYKCVVCDASYKYKNNLESHERLHTGDRPFMCNECGRGFKRNSEMHAHINHVHKKVRKHKCTHLDCDKSYVNLQQLKDHINVHHLNVKSYHCEMCDRTLGTRKQYRAHLRDHLEKRFACRFCESKFPTDLGRKLHEFNSHSTDSDPITM